MAESRKKRGRRKKPEPRITTQMGAFTEFRFPGPYGHTEVVGMASYCMGDTDYSLYLYKAWTNDHLVRLHDWPVENIAFSRNGRRLYVQKLVRERKRGRRKRGEPNFTTKKYRYVYDALTGERLADEAQPGGPKEVKFLLAIAPREHLEMILRWFTPSVHWSADRTTNPYFEYDQRGPPAG